MEPYHPFISAQAQADYLAHYDRRAAAWPVPAATRSVDTFLGQTFVRVSGPPDASPLALLPGSVFSSLMWAPNLAALSQGYRVYAIDNIYDSGRSVYTRAPQNATDFMHWLDELFTGLGLGNNINLMGLSYGSWLTHHYALHAPQRLAKIVLLAHPALVGMNPEFALRFFMCFISPRQFTQFGYWLFQDTARQGPAGQQWVNEVLEEMRLGGRCFKPRVMVVPSTVKDETLRNLRVPALFVFGENEKTFSPHKALQRLQRLAPQVQTALLAQAGHDLSFAQTALVNEKVLAFLKG